MSAAGPDPSVSTKARELSPAARRGRVGFFAFLGLYLTWELVVLVLQVWNDGLFVRDAIIRTLTGVGLFFFAWRGMRWAQLLLCGVFGLVALAAWLTALSGGYETVGWVIAAMGTVLFGGSLAMVLLPGPRAYFEHQRAHD